MLNPDEPFAPAPIGPKPDFLAYRPLPDKSNARLVLDEVRAAWKERGCKAWQVIVLDSEHQYEPYPPGIYCFGWTQDPRVYPTITDFPLEAATEA